MTAASTDRAADYRELAMRIRRHVVQMTSAAKSSHVGTSFSAAELLSVLYAGYLRVNPSRPDWPDRDRFVLSKGHGAAGLYAVLAERGFIPIEQLKTFCRDGSPLIGHASHKVPGVELSTGSLGHGLSVATGMAWAARHDGLKHRTVVMLSDGECDEGSTWEPVLFAAHHGLDNLVVIVDYNKIQSLGRVDEVMALEPFADKWRSWGWGVREIDGHDVTVIEDTLAAVPFTPGRPSCVLAHTVKGKGVSFMENTLLWHYRSPQGAEFDAAMKELDTGS